MKIPSLALVGGLAVTVGLLSTTPASALGNCGPNRHRNYAGYCVWGGQNQDFCLRRTGHPAGYGPHGERICRR